VKRWMPRSLVSVAVLFTFVALAQDREETTEKVDMQVGMPGMPMPMNMNVNVKVKSTTKRTTTRTSSQDYEEPGPDSAPAPAPSFANDCGAGEDPGCTMRRNGHSPLDGPSFLGFLDSMRSNFSELNRADIAATMLKTEYLTARQLGLVLDLFESEINRFDVAKQAAPHLVNPKHALGLSKKFNNSIYATDFSKLMASQR
jgi:hypothetical protein